MAGPEYRLAGLPGVPGFGLAARDLGGAVDMEQAGVVGVRPLERGAGLVRGGLQQDDQSGCSAIRTGVKGRAAGSLKNGL
jgi:hypothetical protein